ncbi:hypothetical protein LI140_02370 [Phocaeicola dorei]|uniref:Crp/Fnr family transcriptional regulator n=1 Tax=Phocaeicola dorei TaxID=357276 RepID=UPI001C394F83|nr:hypothetical protein [Phocaeicola dorei]MBV4238753.1 hypothetical protein [Phocaeicola dorei]MCB6461332.1 hypothetical protein [Phocaeicola dorei]MCB6746475.1 hypothetical protein [Phocaeicola dorei]MCB6772115.1 hypothetical protein [Phocaeicola dorei]MCB6790676.1 hypothetical protein [Phocaeicola dorei]
MNELDDFIQNGLPTGISPAFIEDLKRQSRLASLNKDEVIADEYIKDRQIYYILKGSCIRYIINSKGEERAVMFHTESFMPMVGNMYVGSDGSVVSYRLKTNEKTMLLCLNRSFGEEWIRKDSVFADFIFQNAIRYLSTVNQIQNHLLGLTSEEFLKWLYSNHQTIFRRFRSKDIANFMGLTPIWLSNLKRKIVKI